MKKNAFYFVFLLLIILFIYTFRRDIKESFSLIREHVYTYDELNPFVCYVSNAESYIDKLYFQRILKDYVINITSDDNLEYKSDLAIFPENIILKNKNKNGDYPYDFLCNIGDISFALVQNEDSEHMKSFRDIEGKRLAIKKGGYVEESWLDIIKIFNFTETPIFVYYETDNELIRLFQEKKIDALASLSPHPNETILLLSTLMKIRMLPWNENEQFNDMLMYKIKGLKKTKIDLRFYQSYMYNFSVDHTSFGYSRCLFIKKTFSNDIVYDLTNTTFIYKDIVRPVALLSSEFIPIHQGTRIWLKQRGYVNVYSGDEDPACKLIAGKHECVGDKKDMARKFYDRDLNNILKSEIEELNSLKHLKNAKDKQYLPQYGSYYDLQLRNSYNCINYPRIRNEKECNRVKSVWDRPCLDNDECPFYKANQNYENDFGGCEKGFCKMPLNANRVGYRKYSGNPICHDNTENDPTSCKIYGSMISPDYAFKDDYKTRLRNKDELEQRGIEF